MSDRSRVLKDWGSQILEDLVVLEINLELEDIEDMKKDNFKNIVKEAIRKKTFSYLMKMKNYRKSDIIKEERKHLFKCRVDDINVKANHR